MSNYLGKRGEILHFFVEVAIVNPLEKRNVANDNKPALPAGS